MILLENCISLIVRVLPKKSLTTLHDVGVVVYFADMTMTKWSSPRNFSGLSWTLKEQSANIKYLGVFTYPIATF